LLVSLTVTPGDSHRSLVHLPTSTFPRPQAPSMSATITTTIAARHCPLRPLPLILFYYFFNIKRHKKTKIKKKKANWIVTIRWLLPPLFTLPTPPTPSPPEMIYRPHLSFKLVVSFFQTPIIKTFDFLNFYSRFVCRLDVPAQIKDQKNLVGSDRFALVV
jgi:hypothetical protein